MYDADQTIQKLNLTPHPEGGYFREIYRNREIIRKEHLPEKYKTDRNIGTSIYFLLDKYQVSKFHILKSDELWHFHSGSSFVIHLLHCDGRYEQINLGPNLDKGETPTVIIPQETWFGSTLKDTSTFGLVSCTVFPGFDFEDFKLARREDLLEKFPAYEEIILRLTNEDS